MKLRIGLACAVVIGCALCGRAMVSSLDGRCRLIAELIAALRTMRIHVTEHVEPLKSALQHSGSPLLEEVAKALAQNSEPTMAWARVRKDATNRGGVADCLGAKEIESLDQLFSQLGGTGKSQQDLALLRCIATLEEIEKAEKARLNESARLYTTLGTLLGLAIAVLMI